jgi:hypothetical protein
MSEVANTTGARKGRWLTIGQDRSSQTKLVRLPGGTFLLAQALRRLPLTFGWMAKRPIPDELVDAWLRPAQTQRGVCRDLNKHVRTLDRGTCSLRQSACATLTVRCW